MIRRFLSNRSGATIVEYGVVLAVLSMLIVAGVSTATDGVQSLFTSSASKLDDSTGASD